MNGLESRVVERTFWSRIRRRVAEKRAAGAKPGGGSVGVGLVGVGNIARWAYLPRLRSGHPFKLVAVHDVDSAAMKTVAGDFGAIAAESVEALVGNPGVKAVFVCTPVKFHCEPVLAALAAGKHVLCEKPLAGSVDEARSMWTAAQRAGTAHMVNFSLRFKPEVRLLAELVRSGVLGTIYHVWGAMSQGRWFSEAGEPSSERGDAAPWKYGRDGGVVGDLGPHLIDMFRLCLGEVSEVQAWTRSFRPGPMVSEDAAGMSLSFAGGAVAHVMTSRWATGHKERTWFEISGSLGAVLIEPGSLKSWTRAVPRWRELLLPSGGTNFLEAFHQAVNDRAVRVPDFHDGLRNNEVLDAVLASARSGRAVSMSTPANHPPVGV